MSGDPVVSRLPSGAELRLTRPGSSHVVVCVNGGQAREVEGTWSSTIEWLVGQLAPRFPSLGFAEVRYRVKSWRALDLCVQDASEAIDAAGGARTLLVGFSMGGAVAVGASGDRSVEGVVGLAPWLHDRLDFAPLAGKRLDVLHGSLDRWLPGIPGVSPELSRRGFDRARATGIDGTYALVPGGVHGTALRAPWGGLIALPRARRWQQLLEQRLTLF